jgi:hypothetical protein
VRRTFFKLLLNGLTALSLLLCVAAVVVWVRSHFVADVGKFVRDRPVLREIPAGPGMYKVRSEAGRFSLFAVQAVLDRPTFGALTGRRPTILPCVRFSETAAKGVDFGGVVFSTGSGSMSHGPDLFGVKITPGLAFTRLSVAYWVVVLSAAALPAARVARRMIRKGRARDRRRGMRCTRCGYDLRATPDRCPECGHTAAGGG